MLTGLPAVHSLLIALLLRWQVKSSDADVPVKCPRCSSGAVLDLLCCSVCTCVRSDPTTPSAPSAAQSSSSPCDVEHVDVCADGAATPSSSNPVTTTDATTAFRNTVTTPPSVTAASSTAASASTAAVATTAPLHINRPTSLDTAAATHVRAPPQCGAVAASLLRFVAAVDVEAVITEALTNASILALDAEFPRVRDAVCGRVITELQAMGDRDGKVCDEVAALEAVVTEAADDLGSLHAFLKVKGWVKREVEGERESEGVKSEFEGVKSEFEE